MIYYIILLNLVITKCFSDNLYKLIDDKSFKDEVVLFRIDSETSLIRPEHREHLIPVVMRWEKLDIAIVDIVMVFVTVLF